MDFHWGSCFLVSVWVVATPAWAITWDGELFDRCAQFLSHRPESPITAIKDIYVDLVDREQWTEAEIRSLNLALHQLAGRRIKRLVGPLEYKHPRVLVFAHDRTFQTVIDRSLYSDQYIFFIPKNSSALSIFEYLLTQELPDILELYTPPPKPSSSKKKKRIGSEESPAPSSYPNPTNSSGWGPYM